jgi:hypothetical protein
VAADFLIVITVSPIICDNRTYYVLYTVSIDVKGLAHLVGRGEALGTPISFFGAVSFPASPPRHSASLLVLQKNQLTSPFFIDLGEKKPSTSWEARHQVA